MKNLRLKLLSICLVFFAGITIAQAQAVQVVEPPSSLQQNWDQQALKQNQQELAGMNSGNDDTKFQQMQDEDAAIASGQADADVSTALNGAATAQAALTATQQEEEAGIIANEMAANGFLNIPGFTFTGDYDVDQASYQTAVDAFKADAAAFDAWAEQNPALADQL